MTWYYHNCGRCNSDGSFRNVDPDCGRCSGIGQDWDEGEDARQRLKSVYGSEPRSGTPPKVNHFGKRVFTSVAESDAYHGNTSSGGSSSKSSDGPGFLGWVFIIGLGLFVLSRCG